MWRLVVLVLVLSVSLQDHGCVATFLHDNSSKPSDESPSLNLDLLSVMRVVARQELQNHVRAEVMQTLDNTRATAQAVVDNFMTKIQQYEEQINKMGHLRAESMETAAKEVVDNFTVVVQRHEDKIHKAGQQQLEQFEQLKKVVHEQIDKVTEQQHLKEFEAFKSEVENNVGKINETLHKHQLMLYKGVTLGTKKYYFHSGRGMTWREARQFCVDHDMDLVSLETKEEDDMIAAHKKLLGWDCCQWTAGNMWNTSSWKWLSGEAFTYTNWAFKGFPAMSVCMCLCSGYKWCDCSCLSEIPFICEAN